MSQAVQPTKITTRDDALSEQVRLARTRMLFAGVPTATLTAGGFAVLIVVFVWATMHGVMPNAVLVWLGFTVGLAGLRTWHVMRYRRSSTPLAAHWRTIYMVLMATFSVCWGALVWVVPTDGEPSMISALIGSVVGVTATGASMLGVDRAAVRSWFLPSLTLCSAFTAHYGGPLGWFGFISVTSFGVLLWIEANRAHRRNGEMLTLRYESEQLAQAREQSLREVESLSAAKGRFLATMSHEMRTPLHGILGLSRMLRSDLRSEEGHTQLTLLQNAGEHLLCVINDVLDFSRLKEGRFVLKPTPTHLEQLVRQVCDLSNVNARDKGLTVHLQSQLPPDLQVDVDADRLKQILINLVGNAVKFTDKGHVLVRLRPSTPAPEGRMLVSFEVEDTGCGIPQAELARIFDAFHQVDNRAERMVGGSGLGLSIAQQLCHAMQGDIRCESQEGIGSTFQFTLPLPVSADTQEASSQEAAAHKQPEGRVERMAGVVLLVEDNPVNALVAQATLEKLGLTVTLAENGQRALDWLSQHQADLILMDCHMPVMGGLEATERYRQIERSKGLQPTPIIAMSASSQAEDLHECLAAGMNDFIAKPFVPSDVSRMLRRHLSASPAPKARTMATWTTRATTTAICVPP